MSDTPNRELDRRIRDLVADAVADAPEPPDASTFTQMSGRTNGRRGARWGLFTAIGATAAAAAVIAFVVIPGLGDEAIREIEPVDRPPVTAAPDRSGEPEPTSPPITAPAPTDPATTTPDITAPDETTATTVPATSAPPLAQSVTVPVRYSDAPPLFTPVPFAAVERPSTVDGDVQFAVGDGIIVLIGDDAIMNVLDIATGATTQRQLAVAISQPVFGPDNLLYGLSFTPPTGESQVVPDAAIVAQAIDEDAIEIVGSVDVSPLAYLELPRGTLVAGPDGIYDVDRSQGKVMDYVGSGTVDLPAPALIDRERTEGTVVRSGDGSAEWILSVEQHPNAANPFVGDRPAAPGPNGATRVVRYIGPRLETEQIGRAHV